MLDSVPVSSWSHSSLWFDHAAIIPSDVKSHSASNIRGCRTRARTFICGAGGRLKICTRLEIKCLDVSGQRLYTNESNKTISTEICVWTLKRWRDPQNSSIAFLQLQCTGLWNKTNLTSLSNNDGPCLFWILTTGVGPTTAEPGGTSRWAWRLSLCPWSKTCSTSVSTCINTVFFAISRYSRDWLDFVVVLPTTNIVGRWFLIDASDWLYL